MEGFTLSATPLGTLWCTLEAGKITHLNWNDAPSFTHTLHPARQWLEGYFQGDKTPPNSAWLAPQGTPFQLRVWQELLAIPYGRTRTYGQLAQTLNSVPRAVGGAVGANPLVIFVPCHRVMGTNGTLTGFSAPGGIASKELLLTLEGALDAKLDL
jgi:methylated-DNA-[protein]-cysteine S-methyltransferase